EIFYTAALLHPSTIPTLLRVARRVLIWVEPLLYRTLQIGNRPRHISQLNAASTKQPEFLARAVRCVVLHANPTYHGDIETLCLCTGVTGLAIIGDTYAENLLLAVSAMPIQRFAGFFFQVLCVTEQSPPEEIPARPLLRCLTHLDLFDSLDTPIGLTIMRILPTLPFLTHLAIIQAPQVIHHIDAISSLPFLTHFGINYPIGPLDALCGPLEPILKTCRSLRIVAVLTHNALNLTSRDVPDILRDPRFVLCLWRSWSEGVLDGPNHWTIAEDFVARKRRGEVDANVFWAEEYA
ncbi:hypothetical protein C8F01DRAFT_1166798, partial [Mycena amicta]